MNTKEIKKLKESLSKRREDIFSRVTALEGELHTLETMKEPELEEQAQDIKLAQVLALLDDNEKKQIEEIDWALRKIATGVYGACESCNKGISYKRLKAVPATRLCKRCAAIQEKEPLRVAAPEEMVGPEPEKELPPEYCHLTDAELKTLIMEHVRADARIDREELKVRCHKGVIYLKGTIPSEKERQLLHQILSDIMGLYEIVDHLNVSRIDWERDDIRKRPAAPEEKAGMQIITGDEEIREDVVESVEEGTEYTAPGEPTEEER
ncbi:MAG: TraR/DksA C4-type zinc finger protein [Deltaproteobacteria bacterium]|nr:TraR/DksA C4-type zinc finger protein [Deltaproteobacteria bacterium]